MSRQIASVFFALALAAAAGCTVPNLDLTGKACDADHPCGDGLVCIAGQCLAESAQTDAGPDQADGSVAECKAGDTRPCGSSIGECRLGTQSCVDGHFGECTGGKGPTAETCDGKDNDCDNIVDNHLTLSACEKQQGVCAGSHHRCVGGTEIPCDATDYGADYESGTETRCDGKDNNCDGTIDEGLDDDHDGYGKAGVNCSAGTNDCDDKDATIHPGALETCNGKDDDCSGTADDAAGMTCVQGSLDPASGSYVTSCNTLGSVVCTECAGYVQVPPSEICNGINDDCSVPVPPANGVDDGMNGASIMLASDARTVAPAETYAGGKFLVLWQGTNALNLHTLQADAATGSVMTVDLGSATPEAAALSPAHVVWLEASGTDRVLKAAALSATLQPGQAFQVANPEATLRDAAAWPASGGTLVASVSSPSSIVVAHLEGLTVATLERQTSTAEITSPSFGKIGSGYLVYYQMATTPSMLGARAVDSSGHLGAEVQLAGASGAPIDSPAGAVDAIAYVAHPSAGPSIVLSHVAAGPSFDKSVTLAAPASGKTVSHPAVAQLVDSLQVGGVRDVYFVTWTEQSGSNTAIVNSRQVTWDRTSASFLTPSSEMRLTQSPRDVIAPAAASDGTHFGLLMSSAAASSPATIVFRSTCP